MPVIAKDSMISFPSIPDPRPKKCILLRSSHYVLEYIRMCTLSSITCEIKGMQLKNTWVINGPSTTPFTTPRKSSMSVTSRSPQRPALTVPINIY